MESGLEYIKKVAPTVYEELLIELKEIDDAKEIESVEKYRKNLALGYAVLEAFEQSDADVVVTRRTMEFYIAVKYLTKKSVVRISGKFDIVLADVPCSNTGVFRRRPDALWRFSEKELQNVVKLQQELLELAAGYTSPGGQLVYSTCSIEPEENEILTERFVASHPDFELVSRHLQLPGRQNDGASCFLLKRRF